MVQIGKKNIIIALLLLIVINGCASSQEKTKIEVTWSYKDSCENYYFVLYSANDKFDTTSFVGRTPIIIKDVYAFSGVFQQKILPYQEYYYRGKAFYVASTGDTVYSCVSNLATYIKESFDSPKILKLEVK